MGRTNKGAYSETMQRVNNAFNGPKVYSFAEKNNEFIDLINFVQRKKTWGFMTFGMDYIAVEWTKVRGNEYGAWAATVDGVDGDGKADGEDRGAPFVFSRLCPVSADSIQQAFDYLTSIACTTYHKFIYA